jgi:hypothetical protein
VSQQKGRPESGPLPAHLERDACRKRGAASFRGSHHADQSGTEGVTTRRLYRNDPAQKGRPKPPPRWSTVLRGGLHAVARGRPRPRRDRIKARRGTGQRGAGKGLGPQSTTCGTNLPSSPRPDPERGLCSTLVPLRVSTRPLSRNTSVAPPRRNTTSRGAIGPKASTGRPCTECARGRGERLSTRPDVRLRWGDPSHTMQVDEGCAGWTSAEPHA